MFSERLWMMRELFAMDTPVRLTLIWSQMYAYNIHSFCNCTINWLTLLRWERSRARCSPHEDITGPTQPRSVIRPPTTSPFHDIELLEQQQHPFTTSLISLLSVNLRTVASLHRPAACQRKISSPTASHVSRYPPRPTIHRHDTF